MSAERSERLQYLRNNELRAEIVAAVGGDPARFQGADSRYMRKAHLVNVADTLQPADSDVEPRALQLGQLYEYICRWAGGEYEPNAGSPWGINRDNLKHIHRSVGGCPPEEVVSP